MLFTSKCDWFNQEGGKEYLDYIHKHIQGVRDAYNNIFLPNFGNTVSEKLKRKMGPIIDLHDNSKYSEEEFTPYCKKFYVHHDKTKYDRMEFDRAWMHHQNVNKHHWQYWVLINDTDEPQLQPMEIPLEYIIEMLCDWQSAGKFYGNSAHKWYIDQYNKFIFTPRTRSIIEKYIDVFK